MEKSFSPIVNTRVPERYPECGSPPRGAAQVARVIVFNVNGAFMNKNRIEFSCLELIIGGKRTNIGISLRKPVQVINTMGLTGNVVKSLKTALLKFYSGGLYGISLNICTS